MCLSANQLAHRRPSGAPSSLLSLDCDFISGPQRAPPPRCVREGRPLRGQQSKQPPTPISWNRKQHLRTARDRCHPRPSSLPPSKPRSCFEAQMSASVVRDPLSTEANFAALPFPHRLVGIVALEYHPLKSRTPSICFTSPFPHSLPRSLTYPLHDTYRVTRMVMECLLLTSNSVAVLASNAKTQLTQSSQQKKLFLDNTGHPVSVLSSIAAHTRKSPTS